MNKQTFYFLASLPRSGSTLLTSILNQNSQVYVSHGTHLPEIFKTLDEKFPLLDAVRQQQNLIGYDNLLKTLYPTFFSHINQEFIIDKLPRTIDVKTLLNIMKISNPNFKVIFTVRPILEVLASFIQLCRTTPTINLYDKAIEQSNFPPSKYRSIDDSRCEWIMENESIIKNSIELLNVAISTNYKDHFLIIKYDELTLNPKKTLIKIYNFLNIPYFNHNFNNLTSPNLDDFTLYGIPNLHKVDSVLKKSTTNYETVLSKYIINKYKETLDFLKIFEI